MKTQDPRSELQDGFEPSDLPLMGPDGAPQIPPARARPMPRPSLCHAGPCKHYHRVKIQVDAETPRAVRLPIAPGQGIPGTWEVPRGTMYQAPASFHVATHHYCYPSVGIEMPLGDLPVVDCNLWEPDPDLYTRSNRAQGRDAFWMSEAGKEHLAALDAWATNQAAVTAEADEAERLIAQSMAAPQIGCQSCGRQFDEGELDIEMRCAKCRSERPTLKPRKPGTP